MDNRENGYGNGMQQPVGGRMSAANQPHRQPTSRPSRSELAQYSTANYMNHGVKARRRHARRKTIIIAVVVAVVLLLVIPGVALAASAKNALNDARILMSQGSALVNQIQSGDVQGAQRTATNLNSIAQELDGNVNSILWTPLTFVPVYGEDVKQVRTLANVANRLSEQVLIPITQGLPADGSACLFVNGGFNIPLLQSLLNPIGSASQTIQECAKQVNALGDTHVSQLIEPVMTVKGLMGTLDEISGYATDLSNALPGLLGANGARTYLLVAFGESELRSTGGFPGSTGVLTVDNGRLSVSEMGAPQLPFAPEGSDYLPTTEEEKTIFGTRVGRYFYDAGYIPHFPRAAEIMKAVWDANDRQPIDGIIAVDPVFLQSVLSLTGAVTTSDGTIVDGTNAAEILLKDAYLKYNIESFMESVGDYATASLLAGEAQNAFFSEVASLALDAFFKKMSSINLLDATQMFGDSLANKHFYIWVANSEEQLLIEELDAACAMSYSEVEPELGVYLSTTLGTKGNWYTVFDTTIGEGIKNEDGSTSYKVTTHIENTLSPEEAQGLPTILANADDYARQRARSKGDMALDIYLIAPMGGSITNIQTEGTFAPESLFDGDTWYTQPGIDPMTQASYNGREVWYGVTMIECLQSTTLIYTVTTSPLAIVDLAVDTTPLGRD